jgi:3-oxoadipate enol-lactonase
VTVATVNGVDLFYEVDDRAQGEWIVFAHGGEGTHLHWWQQVAALRDRFKCLTYDARGFAMSGKVPPPPGTDAAVDDLIGLLDHVGVERAWLVGQSMGGGAISGTAKRQPDRVAGLAMADTPFGFFTPALSRWAGEMLDKLRNGFDVTEHLYAPGFPSEQPELHYLYRALGRLNPPRTGPRGLYAFEAMRDHEPVDYGDFPVRTLFILGLEDELTLPWMIRATADAVGGARLVEVAGAGHSVYAERAAAFNQALLEFCTPP